MKLVAAAALFTSAAGSAIGGGIENEVEHIVAMPMQSFKSDCFKKSNLHIKPEANSLLQLDQPGTGINPFKPFETVLKDGFYEAACIKDYMYYRGDKHGDNHVDYKLGPVSNVSIIHYDQVVAKEDQQEVTPTVCFEFCRTVPGMGFFGIVNGMNCYCTPYFNAMASDSSECDSVCEGDNTQMCGGKSKSSLWSMHMCYNTGEDLQQAVAEATGIKATLGVQVGIGNDVAAGLQETGEGVQSAFGNVGDSGGANYGLNMKQTAGKLYELTKAATQEIVAITGQVKAAGQFKDFTDPAHVTGADHLMSEIDETTAKGEAIGMKLEKVLAESHPEAVPQAAEQYYPVMYFVDKEYVEVPTTCVGDVIGEVIAGSADSCAAACDNAIHSCVGYQFFNGGEGNSGCYLLGNFKTGFYYTGCKSKKLTPGKLPVKQQSKLSFLQVNQPAFESGCYAKLSKFEGTTLAVDPSGKCKQCFNELTKADRCY